MKDIDVKIIANYLPQYHRIPENDKWWGEGFTDWVAVKTAVPVFINHEQPRVPLNNNYYSLDDVNSIRWQAQIAKKYGVYGFGIYHYWFSSEQQLLQKPAELLLENNDIDIHYMFIWDNLTWKRTWSKLNRGLDWAPAYDDKKAPENANDSGILAELIYGTEKDWEKHYNYLLPFFKDKRYIKENNRPIFAVFQPRNDIEVLKKMTKYWNKLAKRDGFDGILFLSKDSVWSERLEGKMKYAPFAPTNKRVFLEYKIKDYIAKKKGNIGFFNYDKCWKNILKEAKNAKSDTYLCGFVRYDDSPRRGNKARIIMDASPAKFKKYLSELLKVSKAQGKEYVFLMAWNEWGEGSYLEPDTTSQYDYLKAIQDALESVNE
jgi:hypothetical protein